MTLAQLKSAVKRINQQVAQHEKTFGKGSPAYNKLVTEIEIRFNGHTHTTKSGRIAIDTGTYLTIFEHQINILDRPDFKVAGVKKQAENIIKQEMKNRGMSDEQIKKQKITSKQIISKVNEVAELSDFLNNKLGDYYALRNEIPEIGDLLGQLETGGRKTYSELMRIKEKLEELKSEYYSNTLSDEDINNRKNIGTSFLSEDI